MHFVFEKVRTEVALLDQFQHDAARPAFVLQNAGQFDAMGHAGRIEPDANLFRPVIFAAASPHRAGSNRALADRPYHRPRQGSTGKTAAIR